MFTKLCRTATLIGLMFLGAVTAARAGDQLVYCGYQNLNLVMQEVPSDWWNYGLNESAMWTWNQYMDVYRVTPSDGSWGQNGSNEFAGWPSDSDLFAQWGYHWNGELAMTVYSWYCQCCELLESDVAFNPSQLWTSDKYFAEDNPSYVFYTPVVMHELGHTWGEQDVTENYNYDVPTVMHAYYSDIVQSDWTIHADDAYLVRRDYQNQIGVPYLQDMAVFSHYPGNGLHNTYTDYSTYAPGDYIAVHGLTVENTGTADLANVHIRLFLSTDRFVTDSDTLIGDWYWGSFPAEGWGSFDLGTYVPAWLPNGVYYVGAIISSNGYGGDYMPWNDATRLYGAITVNYQCWDDGFEPNDSWSAAKTVSKGSYYGLQICRYDQDWFKIWVNAGQDLDTHVKFTNATGNLDLYLYDPNLNLVDWSAGLSDDEEVQISNAPAGGYYYLQVAGYLEADNTYSMHLSLSDCGVTFKKFGQGLAGKGGFVPDLSGTNGSCTKGGHSVHISKGLGGAPGSLVIGFKSGDFYPFYGGHFYIDVTGAWGLFSIKLGGTPGVAGAGYLDIQGQDVTVFTGLDIYMQTILVDKAAVQGYSLSNALKMTVGY